MIVETNEWIELYNSREYGCPSDASLEKQREEVSEFQQLLWSYCKHCKRYHEDGISIFEDPKDRRKYYVKLNDAPGRFKK